MPSDLTELELILIEIRALRQDAERDRHFQHEVLEQLRESNHTLNKILAAETGPDLNDGIVLTIQNQNGGTAMPGSATLILGQPPVQAQVVETLKGVPTLDANGNPVFNGPLAFSSDNAAIATVDPAAGLITQVAVGTCNISVLDAVGNLTDSVAVTVQQAAPPPPPPPTPNDGIQMTIASQTSSSSRFRR
jgi:hypothetical protein